MMPEPGCLINPYTLKGDEYQSHIEHTQLFTRLLLEVLKNDYSEIDDEFIADIDIAAIMHDIGKRYIPESIVFKKGLLTQDEYEIMKTHTTKGHQHFLETCHHIDTPRYHMIKDVILYHHERWDGTGYPQQKSETDIPLAARIVALADVFEALISPRSYKLPYSFEKAKHIICENSGSHFDPNIVLAFVKQEKAFRKLTLSLQATFKMEIA
ncbi:HD domain-containing protein [Photobacterium sp. SDRW27]|uniref:HD-GYP domain-containing protein n=1 Tax=Photobacterium obscurum TaxID=2829490 RepID=UPI0022446439|nr:HD domain-containing phosphohydrolase [Photobacterium obscurum]MCW8330160.1 HD domain-containing protein [Photobacterium obscurum]